MRKWHFAGAIAVVAGIPALSSGCEPAPLGELVLIVKTDLAAPKDFDTLLIQVFNEGSLKFKFEGPLPGDPSEEQRVVLPSTLGLVAPEDPTNSIRIEVGVQSGGPEGTLRIVREVVTTIPPDRVAMLHLPIQFLCKKEEITFKDKNNLKPSDCPDGKTCIAGSCEDSVVDSSTLPDYDEKTLFGGSGDPTKGTCFDVATCFSAAVLVDPVTIVLGKDGEGKDICTFPVPAGTNPTSSNYALGVESDGICNGLGCFVVLDAKSDTGWVLDDAKANILLPKAVCESLSDPKINPSLKVLQVVRADTSEKCPQKDVSYQTCGPWSAVESAPPPPAPIAIAGAQDHPISVTFVPGAEGDSAFWTNSGNNSIKGSSLAGGELTVLDSPEPPRDIITATIPDEGNPDTLHSALLWTAAGTNGLGSIYAFVNDAPAGEQLVNLKGMLPQPDGIAFFGTKVFWTEFAEAGKVYYGTLDSTFAEFKETAAFPQLDAQQNPVENPYPARIVADASYVYWTNEGTFDKMNGSIARFQHANAGATTETILTTGTLLAAPRAIAIDLGPDNLAQDLYFATIADGTVWRIPGAGSATPGAPEKFATGLSAPNGIAVDGKNVYIANRGDGTIVYKAKKADENVTPTKITGGQKNPGTILVRGDSLLWVNEGPSASEAQEGSIVKYDKSKL